MLFLEQLGTC